MILLFSGVLGDTRRYRTFHLYQQLRIAGVACQLSYLTDPDLPHYFKEARIIVLHRVPLDGYVGKLIEDAKKRGAFLITDVDDLTFDPQAFQWINSPDFSDPVRKRIYQADMIRQRSTILASHAVTTSTHFLAEQVRTLGKPVWVHRNGFSFDMLQQSESANKNHLRVSDKIVIGYASGTPTHDRDFDLVKPALLNILSSFPNVELHLVGPLNPGPGWDLVAHQVRRFPLVPWRKLPGVLRQFDINLAPLVMDNPFSQSKSEIKYMEAGLVHVPTVASATDAFQYAIRTGENGFLAHNSNEWEKNIRLLIENPDLRNSMADLAYSEIVSHYHPLARAKEWITAVFEEQSLFSITWLDRSIINRSIIDEGTMRDAASACLIPGTIENSPTNFQRGLYSLKHRGLQVLLGELWIYFRRLIAPIFPFPEPNKNTSTGD